MKTDIGKKSAGCVEQRRDGGGKVGGYGWISLPPPQEGEKRPRLEEARYWPQGQGRVSSRGVGGSRSPGRAWGHGGWGIGHLRGGPGIVPYCSMGYRGFSQQGGRPYR